MTSPAELNSRARRAGVVPVLTINDAGQAVTLARALCEGGLDVVEITLRTEAALDAIKAIASSGLDCIVGAGTILSGRDVAAAHKAGAQFLVTPGTPASLVPALQAYDGVVVPGAATASEVMTLYQAGFSLQKFFPAEPAGGAAFLKALYGPLPDVSFMPTGGIRKETMGDYLSLPNVIAVGGSWIAPQGDLDAGNWNAIRGYANDAAQAARNLSGTGRQSG